MQEMEGFLFLRLKMVYIGRVNHGCLVPSLWQENLCKVEVGQLGKVGQGEARGGGNFHP